MDVSAGGRACHPPGRRRPPHPQRSARSGDLDQPRRKTLADFRTGRGAASPGIDKPQRFLGSILELANLASDYGLFRNYNVMVLVGMRSDRAGQHRFYLSGAAFFAAITLLAASRTTSIVPGLTFVSLAMMGTFSMMGPFWATATSLTSGVAAAAGIALINSFGNLGGFFGPFIIGVKRNSGAGFRGGMLIISGLLALAGFIALLVRAHKPFSLPDA